MSSGGSWFVPAWILNAPVWSALTLSGVVVLWYSCSYLLQISVVVRGVIGVIIIVIVVPDAGVDAGGVCVVALGNGVVALGNGVVVLGNGVREMLIEEGRYFLALGRYIFPGTEMTRIQLCHYLSRNSMSSMAVQIVTLVWQCHNVLICCICQP
jgi:hypothetical protein